MRLVGEGVDAAKIDRALMVGEVDARLVRFGQVLSAFEHERTPQERAEPRVKAAHKVVCKAAGRFFSEDHQVDEREELVYRCDG